jgi:trans-aconitate methyltransferase
MNSHFDSIALEFNDLWLFSDHYRNWMVTEIASRLDFDKKDVLVDMGGGTGLFSKLLIENTPLSNIVCVEPSRDMYLEATKIKNICTINEDCETYLQSNGVFSKILFKEVVHHINDRRGAWINVYSLLPHGGKLLIVTRPKNTTLPLFQKALEKFSQNQPSEEKLIAEFDTTGFQLSIETKSFDFVIAKKSWISMLRQRFMSDLQNFSDDEIESGIQEVLGKYCEDDIYAKDTLVFILATKL